MQKGCLVQHFDKARLPWEDREYPVVTHCDWSVKSRDKLLRAKTLKRHPNYEAAKRYGDYYAAQDLVEDLLSDEAFIKLIDLVGTRKPLIVVPSLTKDDPKNVIPIWFARNVAYELGLEVSQDIFQDDRAHRTNRGGFYRLANQTTFHGTVYEGQTYLIADDVLTMGGTAASLRNFIEANGGKVIGFCILADSDPVRKRTRDLGPQMYDLRASQDVVEGLRKKHGRELEQFLKRNCGICFNSLTRQEADFIEFFDKASDIRAGVLAAKEDCLAPNEP